MSELFTIDPDVMNIVLRFLASPVSEGSAITWGLLGSIAIIVFLLSDMGGK